MKKISLRDGLLALVDDEDYESLLQYRWIVPRNVDVRYRYARACVAGKVVFMHRMVMNATTEPAVDHINHDPLDNRKSNLRFATYSQNLSNSIRVKTPKSGYRGVDRMTLRTFKARIRHEGQDYFGPFRTCIIQAARDYDELAIKHKGEFAVLNFPPRTSITPLPFHSSCGGVESRHAVSPLTDRAKHTGGTNRSRLQLFAGVAPGPQDPSILPALEIGREAHSQEDQQAGGGNPELGFFNHRVIP